MSEIKVTKQAGDSRDNKKIISDLVQTPELMNGMVINSYKKDTTGEDRIGIGEILSTLQDNSKALDSDKPLALTERILLAQAQSLNAIFCEMANKASYQSNVEIMDRLLKLGLKAQSQCRATLETLAVIKNPPVVFAKQANIAHNQQVNNAPAPTQGEPLDAEPQAIEHTPTAPLKAKVKASKKVTA